MKMKFNSGVSLIIAILFVSVLMLLTANLAQVNIAAIKNRANKTLSDRAKDVADSALEMAYYFADKKGVGYTGEFQDAITDLNFKKTWNEYIAFLGGLGVDCVDCAGFRVIGRSEDEAKLKIGDTGSEYFSAPAAYKTIYKDANSATVGTGNAAEKCENPDDADDPCHWNRLYLNDIADVPLYYVDNGAIQKLGDPDKIKLRVRAPKCEDTMLQECVNGRIELYPKVVSTQVEYNNHPEYPYNDPKKDKVLIQWLISDLDTGETLFARDELVKNKTNSDKRRPFPNNDTDSKSENFVGNNTEISSGRINDANENFLPLKNFIVWEQNHKGMDLNKKPKEINKIIEKFAKPVLRLNLVGQPRKQLDQSQIPYLEYQILTDKPIADSKISLFGWATISDFYKKFKAEKYLPKTEGGFVLGNL